MRQLAAMAEGRARSLWDHTAAMLAMMATGFSHGKAQFRPATFHPFTQKAHGGDGATLKLDKAETQLVLRSLFLGDGKAKAKTPARQRRRKEERG